MYAVLALCLLGFVAAQAPQPCITPKQWEGNLIEVNEQQRFRVRSRLSYDAIYRREFAVQVVDAGPQETFNEILALFDTQIEYIFNFRTRACTRRPLTRPWRDFGIAPNARSLGESYVGTSALPNAGVLATLWATNFTAPGNETGRTFGIWTYQGCLPVRLVAHSSRYGRTEVDFFDITAGISNPSVFIPRPECLTKEEYAIRDTLFEKPPKENPKIDNVF